MTVKHCFVKISIKFILSANKNWTYLTYNKYKKIVKNEFNN